jgi:hypothetical protein
MEKCGRVNKVQNRQYKNIKLDFPKRGSDLQYTPKNNPNRKSKSKRTCTENFPRKIKSMQGKRQNGPKSKQDFPRRGSDKQYTPL